MNRQLDADAVASKGDFIAYAKQLLADYRANARVKPGSAVRGRDGGWQNESLEHFLESLIAYAEDAEISDDARWTTFAGLLRAGKEYE